MQEVRPTEEPSPEHRTSERTLRELRATRSSQTPDDLLGRMTDLLWVLAVRPSAERGLLGDLHSLVVTGDKPIPPLLLPPPGRGEVPVFQTGSGGGGGRPVTASKRSRRGNTIPPIHNQHFYEVSVPWDSHNLPTILRLYPGNTSDFTAGLLTLERVQKTLRDQTEGWRIDRPVADTGHDAGPTYELCADHQIRPVIPLNQVPAVHPTRPTIKLSPRAIPLCEPTRPGPRRDGRVGLRWPWSTGLRLPGQSRKNRALSYRTG